jgi:hypothetical protein
MITGMRTRLTRLCGGTVLAAAVVLSGALPAQAADTAWGNTGAAYSGGILCQLPGATTVPMATWSVDGQSAFSTADVTSHAGIYGPAPTSGQSSEMVDGQAGMDASEIAAVAYLIGRHGSGGAAQVAEVSADIAAAAGDGRTQARCLGQHGTSAQAAASLWAQARRYAGPYTVTVATPRKAIPGSPVRVSATVRSAAGVGAPGISVTFAAGADTAAATTGANGTARATLTTPVAANTSILATASTTGLTYFASDPPAVALGAPVEYSGTGAFAAGLAPKPVVTVSASSPLVMASGKTTPLAHVSGTYGYSGDGLITLAGPVKPPSGKGCSALRSADYDGAAPLWTGAFTFKGDGTHQAGAVTDLEPGCYAASATATTTNSTPPVKASSGRNVQAVTVSTIQVAQSAGPAIAPAGALSATVTATSPGRARVVTSVTTYGPLATTGGKCSTNLDWRGAPVVGSSAPVPLTTAPRNSPTSTSAPISSAPISSAPISSAPASSAPVGADGPALTATVAGPKVTRVGCYALATHSVVTQDGQSLAVDASVGKVGTTTQVLRPTLAIINNSYDGEQGKAMTGTVTVFGSDAYAGAISVGLVSTPPPPSGCRDAQFTGPAAGNPTHVATAGDGTYTFRTPVATRNLCYAVTATLALKANPAVRAESPRPSDTSTFLAGVVLKAPTNGDIPNANTDSLVRPAITFGVAYAVILGVALFVMLRAALGARSDARTVWPLSPRAR